MLRRQDEVRQRLEGEVAAEAALLGDHVRTGGLAQELFPTESLVRFQVSVDGLRKYCS